MFASRLIQLRNEHSLTQTELAKKIDVSPSTIGMWESGKRKIMPPDLLKLSNLFNVSTDYILGNSDQKSIWKKFDSSHDCEKLSTESKLYEYSFASAYDAISYALHQPKVIEYCGYSNSIEYYYDADGNEIEDTEWTNFRNDVLDYIKFRSSKLSK